MNDYVKNAWLENIVHILDSEKTRVLSQQPVKNGIESLCVAVENGSDVLHLNVLIGKSGFPRLASIEDDRSRLLWSYNEFSEEVGFLGKVNVFEFQGEIILVFVQNKNKIVSTVLLSEFHFMASLWLDGSDASVDRKVALMRALNDGGYKFTYRLNVAEQDIVCIRGGEETNDKVIAERNWSMTLNDLKEQARDIGRLFLKEEDQCF